MPVISVRVDAKLLGSARELGINVSEAARKGVEAEIRKQTALAAIDWLEQHSVKATEPSEVTIRRMRDIMSRHDPALTASENIIRNRAELHRRESGDGR